MKDDDPRKLPIINPKKTLAGKKEAEKGIQRQKRENDFGHFQAIAPLATNRNHYKDDLIDLYGNLQPAVQTLFRDIKMDYDPKWGISQYTPPRVQDGIKSAKRLLSRRYIALKEAGLIKRLNMKITRELGLDPKLTYYMFNPHIMFCRNLDEARAIWERF